jgi:Tol biopolymer transport system component
MRESVFAHGYAPGAGNADWRKRLVRIAKRRWRRIAAGAAVVVAGVIAAGMLVTQPVSYELQPMQMVAHSSRPEMLPTLSPDGRFIVYTVQEGEEMWAHTDLFMRNVAGGEETALTETTAYNEGNSAFSPTGDRLAYSRWDRAEWEEVGYTTCQIVVREFPNGLDRQVGACEGNGPNRLSWTPDGRNLIYSDTSADEGPSRIRILDLANGSVRDLVPPLATGLGDMAARMSPDGEQVAFVRYLSPEIADVHVYDLRRQRLTRVTTGEAWAQIAWADRRNLFLLQNPTATGAELWLTRADGRGPSQSLLPALARISRPDAANGLLAFQVETSAVNLWRSSGGRTTSITEGNQNDYAADFSRNRVLAFARSQAGDWIYLQSPGEQPQRLAQVSGYAPDDLRWSPDGQRLAYTGAQEGRIRLFLVNVRSGVIQPVEIEGDQQIANPAWSPDGRSLVFTGLEAEGPRLFRLRLGSNAPPQAVSDHGWFTAIETPDGLFAVHRVRDGIWRLAPGRSPELVFPEFRPGRDNAVLESQRDWTISNGRFYAVDRSQPGRIRVLSRAVAGGAVRRMVDVEGDFAGSLTVDPVSGDVVFGVAIDTDYDIAVIPFSRR